VILLDTTVLNNFSHIERPDLLQLVLADAATTTQVMAELERDVASGHVPRCDWQWLEVIRLAHLEQESLARIRLVLDDGEASCIAVALERNASLFTDDLLARQYAQRQGIIVSGTLGVLATLMAQKHLTAAQADELLQEMVSHGYRSPVRSLVDMIRRTDS